MMAAGIFLLAAWSPASANCVDVRMMSPKSFESGERQTKTSFAFNEKLVICVKSEMDGFVSLWDAPPKGVFERLMPTEYSKDVVDGIAVEIQKGKEICVGGSDTYPLYIPEDEGRGGGKVSAIVSQKIDGQPQEEDYLIPGRSISRPTMRGLEIQLSIGSSCKPKMNGYVHYTVN